MKNLKIVFLLFVVFLAGCKYKVSDRPNWDTELVAPLIQSSVTLSEMLNDSSLIQENSDNSLTIVYRDTVVSFVLGDYLEVPDTSVRVSVNLDSIRLTTDSIVEKLTLGEIAATAGVDGFLGLFHQDPAGIPFALPPQTGLNLPNNQVDASQWFQQATLIYGTMDIKITNELPTNIENIQFLLRNLGTFGSFDTIIDTTIVVIPKFSEQFLSIPMVGKNIESQMEAQVGNMQTSQIDSGTYIDTSAQFIRLSIIMNDMGASSATAVFPDQNVSNFSNPVVYNFGNDIEITALHIESGYLDVEAENTINDTLVFNYRIPAATRDGEAINITTRLDPAPPGGISVEDTSFFLDGFFIDLTVNGDSTNVFFQEVLGQLIYSGNLVTMDLSDSIMVRYGLRDIVPTYIQGYLGRQDFAFEDYIKMDFFNNISVDHLNLSDPKITLSFENSLGVDGELNIRSIKAFNTRTGGEMSLGGSFLSESMNIPGPKFPNVGQTISTKLQLNKNNSNLRDFFSLLPDSLLFDLEVQANKNGNPAALDNFATNESAITAVLDMELPVKGIVDNLVLEEEMEMDMSSLQVSDNIKSGTLNLLVANYFPFEADIQIYFYSVAGTVVDSLFGPNDIRKAMAGVPNPDGLVDTPMPSTLTVTFDAEKLNRLESQAKTARAKFSLSTKPAGKDVKLYSHYRIDFTLTGDFKYHIDLN